MDNLKSLFATVEIMNKTEAVLDTVHELTKNSGDSDSVSSVGVGAPEGLHGADVGDNFGPLQCSECNDGERAILSSYVSLMRQCIELAEKVGAAKA